MRLERLILENFRQYYGRQRVEFSKDPTHHVTVIHGVNGAGKTSMFMAINWCLYGKKVIENVGELISKEALVSAEAGQLIEASVELHFSHDGQRYVIKRVMGAVQQVDGTIEAYPNEDFMMRRIAADGQAKRENSPLATINAILPSNIRMYFLFDGEKIDQFAKPEAAAEVREAIYLVLRLEILDRARKHLQDQAKEYRKELGKLSGDEKLSDLVEQVNNLDVEHERIETKLVETRREIASAKKHIADIGETLSGMEDVSLLEQNRSDTGQALERARSELELLIEEIQENVSRGYLVEARPIFEKALAVLDDKRVKGQIPSNIRQQFVQDLLDNLTCICGRSIREHSEEHKKLLELLHGTVSTSLENTVLETNGALHERLVEGRNHAEKLQDLMKRRVDVTDRIRILEGELTDLEMQLKNSPQENVARLQKQRQDYGVDVSSYQLEEGRLLERLEGVTKQIEALNDKISKVEKSSKRAQHLSAKYELAQKAANAIDKTYQRHADEMRQKIEAQANEIFHTLIWKDSHFQSIRLDEDYNLEVIDRYGLAARPELSAGERQVLSLSFITAMAQVSGEEAPLVIDTPFGRLSSHHRNTITENLPKLASQLVLFVTDEEFSDQMRNNIQPYIGAEYRLNFDRKTSCTLIEEQ